MFGKHTAICQLVSPIVMIFLHITLQYYQQRDLLSSLSVSVSLPIFPPYFAGLPSHVFLLRLKNRVWREEGGRMFLRLYYWLCGWTKRKIALLTLLFPEQSQWTDPVRAGLQTTQPAGDRLLWAGVHQQQGSHGTVSFLLVLTPTLLRISQLNLIREAILFNFTPGNGQFVSHTVKF